MAGCCGGRCGRGAALAPARGGVGARQDVDGGEAGHAFEQAGSGDATFLVGGALLPGVAKAQDDAPDGEVVALLQQLVQTNTSNPPGNEAQIASC